MSSDYSPSPVPTSSVPETPNTPSPAPLSQVPDFAKIPDNAILTNPEFFARGGHSHVYLVTVWYQERSRACVIKIFDSRHKNEYLAEIEAYRYLAHLNVMKEGIVPAVFAVDKWSRKDLKRVLRDAEYEGGLTFPVRVILMEFIAGSEQVEEDNITVDIAITALRGLRRIHFVGVLHGDIAGRNILLAPGGRVVWIDFSIASCRVGVYQRAIEYGKAEDLFFDDLVNSNVRVH